MSGTIRVVYASEPPFPVTDQDPAAVRYQVGDYWVDAVGGQPTQAEVDAFRRPIVYSSTQPIAGRVTTTDATPKEIFRGTLAQATGYLATLDIIAVGAASPFDRAIIRASAAAARVGAGAILDGQDFVNNPFKTAGASTWSAVASVSGNDFVISVTGQAGKTINWTLRGEFYAYAPGGMP